MHTRIGHRRSAAEEALSILCRSLVAGSAPGHAHAALNRAQRSLAALNGFGQGGAQRPVALVVGFEHEADARRFRDAMRARLEEFALTLHPDKTRLIA